VHSLDSHMPTTEFYESYKSTTYKLFLGRVGERAFFLATISNAFKNTPSPQPSPTSGRGRLSVCSGCSFTLTHTLF
jgi:hypothetical protein